MTRREEGEHSAGRDPDTDSVVVVPIEDFIDLHSFRPQEVPDVAESYLEAAREAGFRQVRLIHGRGQGVQRARVRSRLQSLPWILAFYDAPSPRGGWGATIVELLPWQTEPSK